MLNSLGIRGGEKLWRSAPSTQSAAFISQTKLRDWFFLFFYSDHISSFFWYFSVNNNWFLCASIHILAVACSVFLEVKRKREWFVSMGYCWVNANVYSQWSKEEWGIRSRELVEWHRPSVLVLRKEDSHLQCMLISKLIGSAVTSVEGKHTGTIKCMSIYIYQSTCFRLPCLSCNFVILGAGMVLCYCAYK